MKKIALFISLFFVLALAGCGPIQSEQPAPVNPPIGNDSLGAARDALDTEIGLKGEVVPQGTPLPAVEPPSPTLPATENDLNDLPIR